LVSAQVSYPAKTSVMTEIKNIIKALEGNESLLLVLPKEVSMELDIADQDWLRYKVMDGELVIKKVEPGEGI
jgi:hypothetical protein